MIYSRSYKKAVLAAADITPSYQDEPYCTCGYCEDARAYEEQQFQKLMDAVNNTPRGDAAAEEAHYQSRRATGQNLDAWSRPNPQTPDHSMS